MASRKKKKRRPRMGDLQIGVPAPVQQSYNVSVGGSLHTADLAIGENGIVDVPDELKEQWLVKSIDELQFLKQLGYGASSVVHKALHTPSKTIVAVKRMEIYEKEKRHQLVKELHTLFKTFSCPNLIKFQGAFFKGGEISICLEYMDAGSLEDIIKKVGRIPEEFLAALTKQALEGLQHLHSLSRVHRDIKPANILFNSKGECKLADFGITTELRNSVAHCETFVGTAIYMSPERIQGQEYGLSGDIWALGIALLEASAGRFPYPISDVYIDLIQRISSDDVPQADADLSDDFRDFVALCMQKDPAKRPTVEDLLSDGWLVGSDPEYDMGKFMQDNGLVSD